MVLVAPLAQVLHNVHVGQRREVGVDGPAVGRGQRGGDEGGVAGEHAQGVGEAGVAARVGGLVVFLARAVLEEEVLGEVGAGRPDGHVVERVSGVALGEGLGLGAGLELEQGAHGEGVARRGELGVREGGQQGVDEVEVVGRVADKVAELAAQYDEEGLGRLVVDRREGFGVGEELKVVEVEGGPARPCRGERRHTVVEHLADAVVEDDQRPPQAAAHLALEGGASGVVGLVVVAHALCEAHGDGEDRRERPRVRGGPGRDLGKKSEEGTQRPESNLPGSGTRPSTSHGHSTAEYCS